MFVKRMTKNQGHDCREQQDNKELMDDKAIDQIVDVE